MTGQAYRLYDFPFSGNGYKIRLALTQLGHSFDYLVVDILAGESQTPAFLAINPMGQIPVLVTPDGTILRESNAILFWLTEGTALMPADRLGKTRVLQWMNFEQSTIDKVLGRTRFLRAYPHFRVVADEEWAVWSAEGNRALAVLDRELAGKTFLVGQAYSAADICLYGYVHSGEEGGFHLDGYPNVTRWLDAVRAQPGHIPITAHG
ncbi:MAG TPA: glutathione S-transferase family protein [Caulobacteraceae bacterium]|nr:glutathione S-transferase family protein [Caulobacteraceae bacterium]